MGDIAGILVGIFAIAVLAIVLLKIVNVIWQRLERDPLHYKNADELANALLSRGPDAARPPDGADDNDEDEDVADPDAEAFGYGADRHFNAITGQVEGLVTDDPGDQLDDDELTTFDTLHGYDPDYGDEGDDYEPDLGLDDSDPDRGDWRQRR